MVEELQHAAATGELELRAAGGSGARRIKGKFPYGKRAVLSDGGRNGRPRKEVFAPKAFNYRVEKREQIHLLVAHSYDKPLASTGNGSLALRDTAEALFFEARIAPELERAPFFGDFWGAFLAGLIGGISPGFRIPPPAAVPPEEAEKVEEEDPAEGRALIRTIFQALLFELSLVVMPAYKETEVEARSGLIRPSAPSLHHLRRWRP